MWYWFGNDLASFLFPGYNITTTGGLLATCFALAAMAIFYEGMKIVQVKLRLFTMSSLPERSSGSSENSSLLSRIYPNSFQPLSECHCTSWSKWFLEVFHWSLHTLFGYILMLAVMTYNGYITIALALGSCFGYWIFAPSLIELNFSQFQAKSRSINCTAHCAGELIAAGRQESSTTVDEELASASQADVEVHVHNEEIG